MSGPPGATKSTKAKEIKAYADMYGIASTICSADDYFTDPITQEYKFDRTKLSEAHKSCQSKFNLSVSSTYNWIIVDNTNVDIKSIKPYYDQNNGYKYKIVRPNVDWYFNAEECFKKNTRNVPLETIQRMVDSIKRFSLEDMRMDICWM